MFEVIVTYRPDFRETPRDRYLTWEDARDKAQAFALQHATRLFELGWVQSRDSQVAQDNVSLGSESPLKGRAS